MKKVMLAAVAAMVLVSGASANDLTAKASGFLTNADVTIGAGWAQTDDKGGAGFALNLSSDPLNGVYSKVSAEVSDKYFSVTDTVALGLDNLLDPYLGFGYLKAEGMATTGGGCAPGTMLDGTCLPEDVIPQSSEAVEEKGVFGTVGVSEQFVVGDIAAGLQAGYRFGGVKGPIAGMTFSKKVGSGEDSKSLGLMVNLEQIQNDKEDINRFAVYGTYTF